MGAQSYRGSYLAALTQANDELEQIFYEFEQLELRKEQIEHVVRALQPFLGSVEDFRHEVTRSTPEVTRPATVPAPSYPAEPALPIGGPIFSAELPKEPVVAAAAGSDDILDPIQYRINRALGLAVA